MKSITMPLEFFLDDRLPITITLYSLFLSFSSAHETENAIREGKQILFQSKSSFFDIRAERKLQSNMLLFHGHFADYLFLVYTAP